MLAYILAFIAGIIVKTVDWMDDELKSKNPAKYLLAIIYGGLIGYIIGMASFSLIFLAGLLAQVFARKIDTKAHLLGFLTAGITLLIFGFPSIELEVFFFFLIMAFLDEMEYVGTFRPLSRYRPFLKLAGLAMILMGRWDYFAGIILFDIGYEGSRLVHSRIRPPKSRGRKRRSQNP